MNKNIHLIKDKIFKKNIVKINFCRKTDKSEITKLNFLTHLLFLSSKKYKTERKIINKAKELYDLSEESFINIYGNATILCFRFTFLKDEFTEKDNSLEAAKYIKELLFNPNVKNNKFDKKSFDNAKNEIIDEIKTYHENKNVYSKKKMLEYMDASSPAAIESVGNLEDLEKITPTNLYEFYLDVINNSTLDTFIFGEDLEKNFEFLENKNNLKKFDYIYKSKEREPKTYIERDKINQSRLVMGYNLVDLTPNEAEYSLQIYLYILGLGPSSKLFMNVREKESLCYSISATARYVNSLMMITAGIDAVNFDKAINLIEKQVEDIKKGIFKEKEIEAAKLSIKTSYQEIAENPYSYINSYESTKYLGFSSIKKRMNEIDKVSKEDIIEVANKVKLNTIYLLEGKKK